LDKEEFQIEQSQLTIAMADPDMERKEADKEGGVAVLFDDEDQEEEEEEDYEIRDDTDEEDEREEREGEETTMEGEVQEEDIVTDGEASRKATSKAERDVVSPHSIDGFWVQRQISEIYPDPLTAADKAASVLVILSSESSVRDCENQMVGLFDYQSFHVIAKFFNNREVIIWCTKLMRSNADERVNVEVAFARKRS
jgi:pre-mRNA-splicing helicase BRR2